MPRNNVKSKLVELTCPECGVIFTRLPCHLKPVAPANRTCSRSCRSKRIVRNRFALHRERRAQEVAEQERKWNLQMAALLADFTKDELESEIWRDIPGYEGWFQASNLGRIRRIACIYNRRYSGFKYSLNANGYPRVTLRKTARKSYHTVHRLVAAAFLRPRPSNHDNEVNHIDGNKQNNRITNLEYVTGLENKRHAVSLGLTATGDRNGSRTRPDRQIRGSQCHKAKLTEGQVGEIKKQLANGTAPKVLMAMFGITKGIVSSIKRGTTWRHVT